MSPERAERVRELFDRLADLGPEERAAALARANTEPAVLSEVMALLEADARGGGILDATPSQLAAAFAEHAPEPFEELVGRKVGPYRIERPLGQGGMGAVFLAVRDEVGLRVALKLVRGALGDPHRIARFRREERFLARLSHPLIARLLDVGVASDGTPYLAMEHVEGRPLTAWCEERELGVRERLRLFVDLCEAVAFAHRHLIVHRDLKPSNILVTAGGTVKLLDFGIAKLLEDDAFEEGLTVTGMRILSPEYAAPEQVLGDPVSTATDVHGLGVILYELLTGSRPWRVAGRRPAEVAAAVLGAELRRPSTAMQHRPPSAEDLDAICLRALAREPTSRYASVELLRSDVLRHLEGLPVQARLPTWTYRAGKFVGRHRAGVAVASLASLLVLVGAGAVALQVRRTRTTLEQTRELSAFFMDVFQSTDPAETRGADAPMKSYLDLARVHIDALDDRPLLQARVLALMSRGYVGLGEYRLAEQLATSALERQRTLGGADGADVAASLSALGAARRERGDLPGATEALVEALALRRASLGDDDAETTSTMLSVAEVMRDQGQYAGAEALAREALARRLQGGGYDEGVAEAITGVATVLWHQGGAEPEAERLFRSAISVREELYGPDDFRVDPSITALATFLTAAGRGAEAETLVRRSLELRRAVYGEDDPRAVARLNDLARAILAQDRAVEARDVYEEIVARYRSHPGGDHPMLAVAIEDVAGTFERESRLDSAEVHLGVALAMRSRLEGEADPNVARLHHELGRLQWARGRVVEAEGSLRDAYRLRAASLGTTHPATMESGAMLGRVLTASGNLDEAEGLLRDIASTQEAMLGEPHPELTRTLGYVGTLLTTRGRWREALEVHTRALRLARTALSASDPVRRQVARGLSDHYLARGEPLEAQRILREEAGVAGSGS